MPSRSKWYEYDMIKEIRDGLTEDRATRFLEHSVFEFEVCSRRAIESVLSTPTLNAGSFGLSRNFSGQFSTACHIQAGNSEYLVTVVFGVETKDLASLVPGYSEMEMQLDAVSEVTNVLSGSFVTHHRFAEQFGVIPPSLPFFVPIGHIMRDSWCIQGLLRVNSVKVFLGVAVNRAEGEGRFPCKDP